MSLSLTADPSFTESTDASLDGDGRFEEALRRVSHQPGMLLGLEAVRSEQDYHRRRLTRHAYWLHGSGTVAGLRVSLDATDPGNDTDDTPVRLLVGPGIGLDGLGREVSVSEPHGLDLRAWLETQHATPALWDQLISDGHDSTRNQLWLKVTMRYRDTPSGLQPVLATEVNAGTDPVRPSRMSDGVLFELRPELPPATPGRQHPFAAHAGLRDFASIEPGLGPLDRAHLAAATTPAETRQLELASRLLFAFNPDNQALVARRDTRIEPDDLARTLLARIVIDLTAPGDDGNPGLVINPRRIAIDNLARAFVFNAPALAHLLQPAA
jgi:hypothetical protein